MCLTFVIFSYSNTKLSESGKKHSFEGREWIILKRSKSQLWVCFVHWWLVRVTLVIAFGFLPQIFRRWWELWMILALIYKCSLNGVDNQRWWRHSNPTGWGHPYPTYCYNFFELFALTGGGNIKTLGVSNRTQAQVLMPLQSHPTSHLVEFPIPNI